MIEINYSLILQIVCVIFLYFVLSKFLFRPVIKILEERKSLIEGKREEAAEYEAQTKEKGSQIHEILEKCKKEFRGSLQGEISEAQRRFDDKMTELVDDGQEKLTQTKSDIEKDMDEISGSVEQNSASIYQLILNKLGVQ